MSKKKKKLMADKSVAFTPLVERPFSGTLCDALNGTAERGEEGMAISSAGN